MGARGVEVARVGDDDEQGVRGVQAQGAGGEGGGRSPGPVDGGGPAVFQRRDDGVEAFDPLDGAGEILQAIERGIHHKYCTRVTAWNLPGRRWLRATRRDRLASMKPTAPELPEHEAAILEHLIEPREQTLPKGVARYFLSLKIGRAHV